MGADTLANHARAFYEERGIHMPLLGTLAGDEAYRLWAEWSFSNMAGKKPQAQAEAMAAIEAWDAPHR
jgi:hypothetical protein